MVTPNPGELLFCRASLWSQQGLMVEEKQVFKPQANLECLSQTLSQKHKQKPQPGKESKTQKFATVASPQSVKCTFYGLLGFHPRIFSQGVTV